MILTRIESLRNCGHFEDYSWRSGLREFKRINVIYGPNGTGKSSLSAAFDDLRQEEGGCERVSLTFSDGQNTTTTDRQDSVIFDRVMVFSDRYVDKGHRFRDKPEMSAVLTVGEKSVEEQDRLEEIEQLLEAEEEKKRESKASLERAQKAINSVFEDVSKNVVTLVSKAGGRWRSRTSFSKAKVREAYEQTTSEWQELDDATLQAKIAIINSGKRPKLPAFQSTVSISGDIVDRLKSSLAKTPATIVLDTLEVHPEATSWVQEGRQLHERSSSCIFCSGPLTEERKKSIDEHFSDAVAELEREIDAISGELRAAEIQCETVRLSLPDEGLLLEDLRETYRSSPAFSR